MSNKPSVILIEEDPVISLQLSRLLVQWGYEIFEKCDTITDAILAIKSPLSKPDLLIANIPYTHTEQHLQLLKVFRFLYKTPTLFVTTAPPQTILSANPGSTYFGLLSKPYTTYQMQKAIYNTLYL